MKHCLECLIYLLNRNKYEGVNGEVKSSKSMLIKTGYPNLLHGCDFLCFDVMNYYIRSRVLGGHSWGGLRHTEEIADCCIGNCYRAVIWTGQFGRNLGNFPWEQWKEICFINRFSKFASFLLFSCFGCAQLYIHKFLLILEVIWLYRILKQSSTK